MDIDVRAGEVLSESVELGVLLVGEGDALPTAVAGLLEPADFRGAANQALLLYPRGSVAPRRLLLLGLGARDKLSAEVLRRAGAVAGAQARQLQATAFAVGVPGDLPLAPELVAQALVEGIELGAYRYDRFRTELPDAQRFAVAQATLLAGDALEPMRAGAAVGQAVARGVSLARDLVNAPGNVLNPAAFADQALALGERAGLEVTVLDKAQLTEQGFGGLLAVGQGSANEPRFIVMEYGTAGEGRPTICLVGKGLTFDSGGLSLKPADAMSTMKGDMAGAAAVMGAMETVAELELPLHVVGIVVACENMPSGTAFRPDDVLTTLSGKTIEVLNTDAEGRIALADGLFYAQRYQPDAIVELSTLTGAIIIALGSHASGMMATEQQLADRIARAGEASGERVWQLPLWDEYHEMIKSKIADVKNIGGRPAGSITAGAFLAAFSGDYPFVHLDIAGTAYADPPARPYESPGGTGVGVRLLAAFLSEYSK